MTKVLLGTGAFDNEELNEDYIPGKLCSFYGQSCRHTIGGNEGDLRAIKLE